MVRKKPYVKKASKKLSGKSKYSVDSKKKAMRPGKRVSKTGKTYYENRRNRADKNPRNKGRSL